MRLQDELGKKRTLMVVKKVDFGVYLGTSEEKVLLPKKEVPAGIEIGDPIEVFLYKDSSDRMIATTRTPKLLFGEVKPLKIQIEDTVYEGTAAGIMEQLRDLSFDPTEFPDVETYIWFVQNNVIRTTGMDCPLPDGDAETQAAALLRHLDRFGALKLLEV